MVEAKDLFPELYKNDSQTDMSKMYIALESKIIVFKAKDKNYIDFLKESIFSLPVSIDDLESDSDLAFIKSEQF